MAIRGAKSLALTCAGLCSLGGIGGPPSMLSAVVAGAAAEVPVPSNYQDSASTSSPPAGPLPDPPEGCSEDSGGPEGECAPLSEHSTSSSSSLQSPSPASPLEAIPTAKWYCPEEVDLNSEHSVYGNVDCFLDVPPAATTSNNTNNSFVSPRLNTGDVAPIVWRDTGKIVTQYAFQVGLPPELITSLLSYCEELGMIELFRKLTSDAPIPPKDAGHNGRFVNFTDSERGNEWYAQRPERKWRSNMHWISPANEKTHESYLRVLGEGGFDKVLEAIGTSLKLDSLAAYHLTFIAVSHSERGFRHYDTRETKGGVYNVIIPLLVEEDDSPELILWDDVDEDKRGGYKYKVGVGAMMGDDAMHGTHECDYRNLTNAKHGGYLDDDAVEGGKRKIGMRLAATVYIAELYPENVAKVAEQTLTQIFPLRDERWLLAQEARHWQDKSVEEYKDVNSTMREDRGRLAFRWDDDTDDCEDMWEEGMCYSDGKRTRKLCPFSCKVYVEEGPTRIEWIHEKQEDGNGEYAGEGEKLVNVCTQNRTGIETCRTYEDDTSLPGEFITPTNLEPGEMFPMVWREDAKRSTDYAFQIGLPPELTPALLDYANELGITDVMRGLTGDSPLPVSPDGGFAHSFYDVDPEGEDHEWYVQRPPLKWTSNMHWISPAIERTHEEYLEVLGKGNFDVVLESIGNYLGLESLAAYHLTFIGVSHSEKGFMHRDTHHTGASVYNVIIPLILEDGSGPELVMSDEDDSNRKGGLKYKLGYGAMMGDDAMHGTQACDYRANKGMRLAATVYIADINERNAKRIAKQTLTQIFPLPDKDWLMTQVGRHWKAPGFPAVAEDGEVKEEERNSLATDPGRQPFQFKDMLSDCSKRARMGMCKSDIEYTRIKCLRSCQIYEVYWDVEESKDEYEEFEFVFEEYRIGDKIDAFFDGLDDDEDCEDENEECEEKAADGMCLTDVDKMEELGCEMSCLYCLTKSSKEMFSLGVDQVMQVEDDEDSEDEDRDESKERPSPRDVAEVMARTEHYFVNEVLVFDDLSAYRLPCQNTDEKCAYWAADGYCESNPGYMGKHCPAACLDCPMSDLSVRCPIDKSTNIFKPGDLNAMFERWMQEAGQDVAKFSSENLPTGGTHPDVGEMTVITSPYHDASKYPLDEDEDESQLHSLPWLISIEDFLTAEECDRLIELGTKRGYERSTSYDEGTNADGSARFKEDDERTSWNTFCQDECGRDPMVKGIIKRMEKLTGIPYDNYESLQLVRYEAGQYYEEHHDGTELHNKYPYGPRIATIFLYLNDVEDGGETRFKYLMHTAKPKKGMALVWPSADNEDLEARDDWTWHEALPVVKGIKYGANAWIHLRDFQSSPDYC